MIKKIIFRLVVPIAIATLVYFVLQTKPAINETITAPDINSENIFNVKTKEIVKPIVNYNNSQYGFEITLTDSWQGYSIISDIWNGELLNTPNTKYQGPKILIRNPKWTEERHWQDIPILVFTPAEWKLIQDENLGISAAPIGPSKLAENANYVFALPPRWLGFTDDLGQDDAAEIVKTFRTYSN